MYLVDSLISRKCKKQVVSKSSTEADYCPMFSSCYENHLGFEDSLLNWASTQHQTTLVHAGNASGIQIGANPVFRKYTRHIKVDCHFIGDAYYQDIITHPHIPSNLQKC